MQKQILLSPNEKRIVTILQETTISSFDFITSVSVFCDEQEILKYKNCHERTYKGWLHSNTEIKVLNEYIVTSTTTQFIDNKVGDTGVLRIEKIYDFKGKCLYGTYRTPDDKPFVERDENEIDTLAKLVQNNRKKFATRNKKPDNTK